MNIIYSSTNHTVSAPVAVTSKNFALLSSEVQVQAPVTYHALTKLEIVQSAIFNAAYQDEQSIAAHEYWDKELTRSQVINHLIEFAKQFIPCHLNVDRILRREVNQEFRIRIM